MYHAANPDGCGLVEIVMLIHPGQTNLVCTILVDRAGLAVIRHFTKNLNPAEIWSLRKDTSGQTVGCLSPDQQSLPPRSKRRIP